MDRSSASSKSRGSLGLWFSGILLLPSTLWLGVFLREYGAIASDPDAAIRETAFWSEKSLVGEAIALGALVIGGVVFYFSWRRRTRRRRHHDRQWAATAAAHRDGSRTKASEEKPAPAAAAEPAQSAAPPTDASGAPRKRVKVRVRVKERIKGRTNQ